jgi:cation:H+ antiporter
VGLTVVAFGTSAPELVVSVGSALSGNANIAVGNVVGSNIANILLIVGASALVLPIVVVSRVVRWDVPLMIAVSLVFSVLALDGRLSRFDGWLLLAGIFGYTGWQLRQGRQAPESDVEQPSGAGTPRWGAVGLVVLGLGALWLGGRSFVAGSVSLARAWGLSELVIGLTIVAVGTSLPEMATSLVASVRGESDLAVGNIVGSNVFNILAVMGASALLAPEAIAIAPTALRFDIPVMVAAAVVCLPIVFTGGVVARWEGAMLLGYYGAYVGFVIGSVRLPTLAPYFGRWVVWVVLPVTLVTLGLSVFASIRARRS